MTIDRAATSRMPAADITDHLATFGRVRCNWLAVDTWQTEARAPGIDDLCPNRQSWYVEAVGGRGTVFTTVCSEHVRPVRRSAGFRANYPYGVQFEPAYGIQFDSGKVLATFVPGGFWAVKVRPRDGLWAVSAVPRNGTVGEPFNIAFGVDREATLNAGILWANCASVMTCRMDRIVFAGFGDATNETPLTPTGEHDTEEN